MRAATENGMVKCPFCKCPTLSVFRREVREDQSVRHHCRCDKCGSELWYEVDKFGEFVNEPPKQKDAAQTPAAEPAKPIVALAKTG
jgi:hypothetical protein